MTAAFEPLRTRLLLLCGGPVDWTQTDEEGPPLSSEGLAAAELAASTLPHFDAIVASPQRASQEAAETIRTHRPVPALVRDGLEEIRTASLLTDAEAYDEWMDRLFESYENAGDGESLAEGVDRITGTLRAIGDRFYGRSILVVSHPITLLAFRSRLIHESITRDQVDALPDLALAIVDYLEGRYYLVQDFPVRKWIG